MTSLAAALLIISQLAIVTSDRNINLDGQNCNEYQFKKTEIVPDEKIQLVWDSDMESKCSLSISLKKKDIMDIYKICLRFEVFKMECDSSLTYYQDGSIEDHTKTCGDSPTEWCGDQDRSIYLTVKTKSHILDPLLDLTGINSDSYMKLSLYTEKVYSVEDSKRIAVYIGYGAGALAGLGLIIIIVGCVVCRVRRQRRRTPRARPDDFATQTMVPSQGHCDVNRDFSRSLVGPTAPPAVHVERETVDPDLTDLPPPSYDEVMAMEEDEEPDSK